MRVRTAVLYESYGFGSGVLIDNISELTVPVVVNLRPARALGVTLSGGFASVSLSSQNDTLLADQKLSGPLDTEFRLTYDLVPGRLVLLGTGAIPSGTKTVAFEELSILGALSSDLVGFSAPTLGTGGNYGLGVAGAVPLGGWALGYGATFRQSVSYHPLAGATDTSLAPGSEMRLRTGLEGALGRRTYLRVAMIYAARGKDKINNVQQNGIGNRVIGYLAVNRGFGSSQLSVYGFDVFRGSPQLESSAVGAAIFPRGNLLALGARWQFGSGARTITPRVEYRVSATAQDTTDTTLRRAGSTVRLGADVRMPLGLRYTLVFQGSYMAGNVVQGGENVSMSGFRSGVNLEWRP